jgi:hypothetical protein
MTSPFASVGLARGNDADRAAAHRVDDDEQPAFDPAIEAIADLPILPMLVNLDLPARVDKGGKHEGKGESSFGQALLTFAIVPFKFHRCLLM